MYVLRMENESFKIENPVSSCSRLGSLFKKLPLEHHEDACTVFEALGKVVGKAF
jgi:hypothetical protein